VIIDPERIPNEIKDQIESAADDLGKGLVHLVDGVPPPNTDPRVTFLAQAFQRTLTAFAMMILPGE
jgi:hypothetical protein